jgi:hypothetical protein
MRMMELRAHFLGLATSLKVPAPSRGLVVDICVDATLMDLPTMSPGRAACGAAQLWLDWCCPEIGGDARIALAEAVGAFTEQRLSNQHDDSAHGSSTG